MYSRSFFPRSRSSYFLFGPRGTGKSSWLKALYKKSNYIDLLDDEIYNNLTAQPKNLIHYISDSKLPVIVDEVQKIHHLLDEIHRLIELYKYQFTTKWPKILIMNHPLIKYIQKATHPKLASALKLFSLFLICTCFIILNSQTALGGEIADKVVVIKSRAVLQLQKNNKIFAEFPVVFGGNPLGHKQQEGDQRTPEGSYHLDYKNPKSGFHKSIHISYPNELDSNKAKSRGVSPGGQVMIHGQKNGFGWLSFLVQKFNWTNGCVALDNADMDSVWEAIEPGTPIEIKP